jgi:septum formation protein
LKKLILASASPRRRDLLARLGIEFIIDPACISERIDPNIKPYDTVKNVSYQKAAAIVSKYRDAVIIAADTVIVVEDNTIGKPSDMVRARDMLSMLNGRFHTVITGLTLIDADTGKTVSKVVETRVHLRKLTDTEIESYIAMENPLDKAGGYAIQGLGGVLIDRIEGDYYNVVGLPLAALVEGLKQFDICIL